jgi:peptide/nickel transport system permease protein
LFGVTLITFLIFNVVGGDPALQLAGKYATLEQVKEIRTELGLDRSLPLQYGDFVKQTLTFNWGRSWQTQSKISDMIWAGLGPSLCLTLPAFFISFLLAIAVALFSASAHGSQLVWDRGITTLCLALMSISFLVYIIGLQYFLAFKLDLFPLNGWNESWVGRWPYLFLPWIIAIVVSLGPNILIFRAAFLDEVIQDYVRTAQAKGLGRWSLFSKHILKNAMVPIVTIVVMQVPFLIMGNLLLEHFFGIPGIGGLLIQAIQSADLPVVKAFTVFGSLLYLFFNLAADLLYLVFDPRVELR